MKSADLQPVLLRVVVGSQAHGLAREDSDTDYREVFAIPTSEMLSLGHGRLKFAWQSEGRHIDDEGGYEIAEWLHLIAKGAPNAVEMCFAPIDPNWGPQAFSENFNVFPEEVQQIGRLMLSRKPVQDGTIGYAMNSFRKIADRPGKWKAGMLRVLYQGQRLLYSGETSLDVPDDGWGKRVRRAAANELSDGEVLDEANGIIEQIKAAPSALPDAPDYETVNRWLLTLRRELWA